MAERSGLTVAAGLWGIAFAALGMTALTTTADARRVIGLTSVGHALTGLALVLTFADRDGKRSLAGRATTILYLAIFLMIELAGLLFMLTMGERNLALWFALGASFSALGSVLTWRNVPGDDVLACQLFFHSAIIAPLVAALPVFLIDLTRNQDLSGTPLGLTTMSLTVSVGCAVAIPLLVVALLTALAYNVSRPRSNQALAWSVLTAHQLMFAVLVFRWAANGL
ncbi:hypothetical protein V5E97_36410 [Singulisphaera sp. Ch08]|uniref:Uncharacterized protein n=1 Tax=Singulisphaera sp. Ch08 TaxID=3120278 RepID=A0AAU7CF21_9BACT